MSLREMLSMTLHLLPVQLHETAVFGLILEGAGGAVKIEHERPSFL